jgi:hypothetical protein
MTRFPASSALVPKKREGVTEPLQPSPAPERGGTVAKADGPGLGDQDREAEAGNVREVFPCEESGSASSSFSGPTLEGGPPGPPGIASPRPRGARSGCLKGKAQPNAGSPVNRMGGREDSLRRPLEVLGTVGGTSLAGHALECFPLRRFPVSSGPNPDEEFPCPASWRP